MSEEKIIDRRNRLIEMAKVEARPYTPFYYLVEENINSINYLLYKNKQLNSILTELEEWLIQQVNKDWDFSTGERNSYEAYEDSLDKIQELKEKYK